MSDGSRDFGEHWGKEQSLEFEILNQIGKVLASELDISQILSNILDACRDLVSAEAWTILLKDPLRDRLLFSRTIGQKSKELEDKSIAIGQGIAGKVALTGEPQIVDDVTKSKDFYPGIDERTGFQTKSIMAIPMISRGKLLGVIEIINKLKGKSFSKVDLKKVQIYTDFASIALENAQLYEQALTSAITDDLTGLYNNRFINKKLAIELQIAKQKGEKLGFIFIDLDRFKKVNDNYGHLAGSSLLREVGYYIKDKIGDQTDMIARYGGDEFLIVIPGQDSKQTLKTAEELREGLFETVFNLDNSVDARITASFGVASYPEQAETLEELIGMADKAMYEVKEDNRNGVRVFSS